MFSGIFHMISADVVNWVQKTISFENNQLYSAILFNVSGFLKRIISSKIVNQVLRLARMKSLKY